MTDFALPVSKAIQILLLPEEHYENPVMMTESITSSPGFSLIMDVRNVNIRANKAAIIKLYTESWPITVLAFALTGISGMFIWVLEFPRSFVKGSYEGFWWAFVTMTTVGYGDKTPKFILGRLFGVIWIMFGLILVAVFTATATSALSTNMHSFVRVEGNKIGVLNNTSAGLEAKKKGAFVTTFSSVKKMFSSLRSDEIDGVLMDRFRAAVILRAMRERTIRVFTSYDVKVPYYLAIRDTLRDLVAEGSCFKNRIERQDFESLFIKYLEPTVMFNTDTDSYNVFSGDSPNTRRFLLIVVCVFLGSAFTGITAEVIYRKLRKGNLRVKTGEDPENGHDLREVSVHSVAKPNLTNVENKLRQLVDEVSKLREQMSTISSNTDGSFREERRGTTHM
ncbi:uncharacterized protein LOC111336324 [Stylophora pistillata]|uniref:uncharacterized protein LOC111336324 n=1 Tax=Stylophora pistillata TaxID=50429 RepID=UPI000C04E636|nr:uncharacterized protein LOC111336324 [Stylophora pistillata]